MRRSFKTKIPVVLKMLTPRLHLTLLLEGWGEQAKRHIRHKAKLIANELLVKIYKSIKGLLDIIAYASAAKIRGDLFLLAPRAEWIILIAHAVAV